MIIQIKREDLEISRKYQAACLKCGGSFRHGCPNYGKKEGCPPRRLFSEDYDLDKLIYLISTDFDLEPHTGKIRETHPNWTEKAVYNPRYWQATARKLHALDVENFLLGHSGYVVERTPEGSGINVDALCRKFGIVLEWPPRKLTRLISIGAMKK